MNKVNPKSGLEMLTYYHNIDHLLKARYPLHLACKEGHIYTLHEMYNNFPYNDLLEKDVHLGWNPAHWAVYFQQHQALEFIVAKDPRLMKSESAHFSQSPLHFAAGMGDQNAVEWLLSKGSDPNLRDTLGETPLHKAARNGSEKCVALLLSAGANTNVLNNSGQNPRDLASSYGHYHASTLLFNVHQERQKVYKVKRTLEVDEGVHQQLKRSKVDVVDGSVVLNADAVFADLVYEDPERNGLVNQVAYDVNAVVQVVNGSVQPDTDVVFDEVGVEVNAVRNGLENQAVYAANAVVQDVGVFKTTLPQVLESLETVNKVPFHPHSMRFRHAFWC